MNHIKNKTYIEYEKEYLINKNKSKKLIKYLISIKKSNFMNIKDNSLIASELHAEQIFNSVSKTSNINKNTVLK